MNVADEQLRAEEAWRGGTQDLRAALNLMFLSWYLYVEPPFLTGAIGREPDSALMAQAIAVVQAAAQDGDLEASLVLGYAAWFAPYAFGDPLRWSDEAARMLDKAITLATSQKRSDAEIRLVDFYRQAAYCPKKAGTSPQPESQDCFADLFHTDDSYGHYFRWIFARR